MNVLSSSITRGLGDQSKYMYIGGEYKTDANGKTDLSIIKINPAEISTTSTLTRLVYWIDDCNDLSDTGYPYEDTAPYISHMAFMESDENSNDQLFGIASSSKYTVSTDTFNNPKKAYIWRVELDSNGDPNETPGDFRVKRLSLCLNGKVD